MDKSRRSVRSGSELPSLRPVPLYAPSDEIGMDPISLHQRHRAPSAFARWATPQVSPQALSRGVWRGVTDVLVEARRHRAERLSRAAPRQRSDERRELALDCPRPRCNHLRTFVEYVSRGDGR